MSEKPQTPAIQQEPITDKVLAKVTQFQELGQLVLPDGYHAGNSLKSASLILAETVNAKGEPALKVCTSGSVANSLLEMVVQGLNPIKGQCSFIVRGNKLCMQREYAGTIAIAKREYPIDLPKAHVVFEGDIFKYETNPNNGRIRIIEHTTELKNRDITKIVGAYCIIPFTDGTSDVEVMSMAEIRKAWEQGATKGNSPAHRNFPDQMAEKTVINRALKRYVNSTGDPIADIITDDEQKQTHETKDVLFEEINIDQEMQTPEPVQIAEPIKTDEKHPF